MVGREITTLDQVVGCRRALEVVFTSGRVESCTQALEVDSIPGRVEVFTRVQEEDVIQVRATNLTGAINLPGKLF